MIAYFDKLKAQISREEGIRSLAYDDANGRTITSGAVIKGRPTIGIGRELSQHGLSTDEVDYLFNNDVADICTRLDAKIPWWRNLAEARQAVMIDMAFNMGIGGLMGWPHTLSMIQNGQYQDAAQSLRDSLWAKQVGSRAQRLADQMERGTW